MEKIAVFGEVLFDSYPDRQIIGGAPFNFCAHASALGHNTALISAVGHDSLGEKVKKALTHFNIDKTYLNEVDYPTGICRVTLSESLSPKYELCENQAYDNIILSDSRLEQLAAEPRKCLYFGTLALRNAVSRSTFSRIIRSCSFDEVFYDINIRQSFYSRDILDCGLKQASVLKFSREEAGIFRLLGIDFENTDVLCKKLAERCGRLKFILLTLDSDGAKIFDTKNNTFFYRKAASCRLVSPVGAGDSFFAGFIHGMLSGAKPEKCLENAIDLSAYVIGHTDAVPEYDDTIKAKLNI